MNKNILKHFGLAALFVLGAKADAEDATPETLASLVAAAENGATVTLGAGTFTLAGSSAAVNKTITLVGKGAGETTFVVGNGTSDGNQGTSDGCFNGSHATLKDMKIVEYPGFTSYLGFLTGENSSLEFVGCTFENTHFSNWSRDNRFIGCTFTQSNTSWYNVQELRGRSGDRYCFESCEFLSAGGRFINAYKQGGTGTTVYLTVKNCSFSGETQSKAAVNLKSAPGDGCCLQLDFLGENKTTNVKAGANTGDPLFDDNGNYGVVTANGSKIWENGTAVTPVSAVVEVISADGVTTNGYPTLAEAFAAVPWVERPANGPTVRLLEDVDLGGAPWTPVTFCGIFDGNGKTISNLTVTDTTGYAGFFGRFRGTARDVTFANADITGSNYAAVFAANVSNAGGASDDNLQMLIENVSVAASIVRGVQKCGGIIGQFSESNGHLEIRGCEIDTLQIAGKDADGVWQAGGLVGYLQTLGTEDANIHGNTVRNVTIDDANVAHYKENGYSHDFFSNPFIGDVINKSKGSNTFGTVVLSDNVVAGKNSGFQNGPKSNAFIGDFYMQEEASEVFKIEIDGKDVTIAAVPETKVVVPAESEIKPVDEEGKEIAGDDAEKAKAAAKAAVEDLGKNSAATMTEGTGVEAAVFAPGEEVKAEVAADLQKAADAVTQDDKGNKLSPAERQEVQAKVATITESKDVSSYVKIDVKSPVVKVEDAVATVKKLVFDVQPMAVSKITTTVDTANPKTVTVEAPVDYNDGAKPIAFRLPLTDAFTVSAIVMHEGDPDRLCMVQGAAGSRYIEMSATHFSLFTATPSEIVETTAESKTVLGIKRVDYTVTQKTEDLAAAVPWLRAADAKMPVSGLITTGLSAGDMIQVYDLGKKTYYSWHYDGAKWQADQLSNGVVVPSADECELERGTAFWYKPNGVKSGTYTQVGYFSEATVTTEVNNVHADASAVAFAKPVHNLLASPKYEDFDIKAKLTAAAGCANDDVIVIVATGKRYRFNGSVWGEDKVVEKTSRFDNKTYRTTEFVAAAEDIVVPAGTAFWYLSAGGAPKVAW